MRYISPAINHTTQHTRTWEHEIIFARLHGMAGSMPVLRDVIEFEFSVRCDTPNKMLDEIVFLKARNDLCAPSIVDGGRDRYTIL